MSVSFLRQDLPRTYPGSRRYGRIRPGQAWNKAILEVAMSVSGGPDASVRIHTADLDDASIGQLASRLSEQVSRLMHDELALAQFEAKRKAKKLGLGVGMFGASGLLAVFGAGCAIAAAVLGLATTVSAWLAAVIVGAALFVIAGVVALIGRKDVKQASPPVPTEAVQSTKHDLATVRQAVKR
jgi:hypothetical protein